MKPVANQVSPPTQQTLPKIPNRSGEQLSSLYRDTERELENAVYCYFATNFNESNARSASAGMGAPSGAIASKANRRLFFQ
jgi:uridine phosphorylase